MHFMGAGAIHGAPPCAQFHDDFETFKKGIYKVKNY